MRNVQCLFISPETKSAGELHRRFSVKDIADMLVVGKNISDVLMTYIHQLNFPMAHEYIANMHFTAKRLSTNKSLELNVDDIINVPALVLMSPMQLMTSIAYFNQRTDPYILAMDPVILPFDVTEDPTLCGWTIQEHSSDI